MLLGVDVQPVAAEPGAQGGERAARHTSGASRRRSAHARLKAWVHKSSTSSQSLYRPLTSAGTACGPARLSKGLCAGRLFSFAAVAPPPHLAGSPAPGTPRSAPAAPACHQLLAARCGSPPPVEPVNNSVNKCRRSRSASRASQWAHRWKERLGRVLARIPGLHATSAQVHHDGVDLIWPTTAACCRTRVPWSRSMQRLRGHKALPPPYIAHAGSVDTTCSPTAPLAGAPPLQHTIAQTGRRSLETSPALPP